MSTGSSAPVKEITVTSTANVAIWRGGWLEVTRNAPEQFAVGIGSVVGLVGEAGVDHAHEVASAVGKKMLTTLQPACGVSGKLTVATTTALLRIAISGSTLSPCFRRKSSHVNCSVSGVILIWPPLSNAACRVAKVAVRGKEQPPKLRLVELLARACAEHGRQLEDVGRTQFILKVFAGQGIGFLIVGQRQQPAHPGQVDIVFDKGGKNVALHCV